MCRSRRTPSTGMSRRTLSGAVSTGYCRPIGAKPMPTPTLTQLEEQFPVAEVTDDATGYAFAGERGVTQQASRPPGRYLDEPLVGELSQVDFCLIGAAIAGAGAGLLFKAALSIAITTAKPGSTAGVLAMFFVVAYLGLGPAPVLLTAVTHVMSSRSALILFSAVILAISVIAARLRTAALRRRPPGGGPFGRSPPWPRGSPIHEDDRTGCCSESLRTNADDRLPLASLGGVEG
jgi:hypothetical protein